MKIFKYIKYLFALNKGVHHTDEFIHDISFGTLETFFLLSFFLLGIIIGGLGFFGFSYDNNLALILASLFLIVFLFDIFIFIKVRNIFKKISKKIAQFSQEGYQKITHAQSKKEDEDWVIDIEYE